MARKIVLNAAAILFLAFIYAASIRGEEKGNAATDPGLKPTPTWTTAQQKAYENRMKMYHKPFFMKPVTFVCAFCGYKGDKPGLCPRCGFELTRYEGPTKAPAHKGMAYHCEKCGLQSNKPGTCPHCGGKMVKNP